MITTQKLRYIAAQEDSVGAIVASLTQDPPHSFPVDVSMFVPNPVPHRVWIYSTPDASPGTLVAEFTYDPTYTNVKVRARLQLTVGGMGAFDPQDGEIGIPVNPDLIGWEWYPQVRSMGGVLADIEFVKKESVLGAGFDYFELTDGAVFTAPDYVFIDFLPQISTSQPVFTYLNLYTDIREITGSETMDATYYRKVCEIITAGTAPVVTLLNLVNVPANTLLVFSTMLGAQKGATISAASGEFIKYNNISYGSIFLGEVDVVWIMRRPDGWHVVSQWEGMARVGVQTSVDIPRPNTIVFNGGGLIGGGGAPAPLPRAVYPRVEWYVFNVLPGGYLISKADRDAGGDDKAGYWAFDATNIWAPDYRGTSRRALPGTRGNDSTRDNTAITGNYKPDQIKKHKHMTIVDTTIESGGFPAFVNFIKSMIKAYSKSSSGGKESTYMAGAGDNVQPTIAPTNDGGVDLKDETVGKTTAVLMGCYA